MRGEKLREKNHWVDAAFKNMGDAVITTDKAGSLTFMNPVAENLTGWKLEEAIGKDLGEELNILKDKRITSGVVRKKYTSENWVTEEIESNTQAVLVSKKGEKIPIRYSKTPIYDERDDTLGCVLVLRDITPQRKVEEILKQNSEKLRKAIEGTIQAISLVVETRDHYTATHQRRVANLACAIAEKMGLVEERVNGILVAGVFHDIGKIYLPKEILNKPGKLTNSEYAVIMNHSQVGYEILKAVNFPWPIAQMVLQHHERMNGSGYPNGLLGEDILLEARILAVADVVEAMSSDRPYRRALGIDVALEEIERERGKTFDPEVVYACLKLFREDGYKLD